jgi:hypothetical protein
LACSINSASLGSVPFGCRGSVKLPVPGRNRWDAA